MSNIFKQMKSFITLSVLAVAFSITALSFQERNTSDIARVLDVDPALQNTKVARVLDVDPKSYLS